MATKLRTPETWQRYQNAPKRNAEECFMCEDALEVVVEFDHWLIVKNQFPYDEIADLHDMLLPKRHFAIERDANDEEAAEVLEILRILDEEGRYDAIMKNFRVGQSHPVHFHYHLLRYIRL